MRFLRKLICELFHGGGMVKRDAQGRINWQCSTCGRWGDHPVEPDVERYVVDKEIARREAEMRGRLCHCGAPARVNLDGDDLCQCHADQWLRSEGAAAREYQH